MLLNLAAPGRFDMAPWAGRVNTVDARFTGRWELPVLGEVGPPDAVLIRPDGHVAWVDGATDEPLADALTRWFGGSPAGPTNPDRHR